VAAAGQQFTTVTAEHVRRAASEIFLSEKNIEG
jgi:hypothetical protein